MQLPTYATYSSSTIVHISTEIKCQSVKFSIIHNRNFGKDSIEKEWQLAKINQCIKPTNCCAKNIKSSLHLIMCGRLELWCDILSSCRERKFLIYCPWSEQPELSDRASTHQTYHDLNPDHPILPWYLDYLDIYLILSRYHPDLNLISAAQALWQSIHSTK